MYSAQEGPTLRSIRPKTKTLLDPLLGLGLVELMQLHVGSRCTDHASFGGAVFQTLRKFYGTDHIEFAFDSLVMNGKTVTPGGTVMQPEERSFSSLSQAEEENGQSRIYLGVHWVFDKTEGILLGRKVADYVYAHAFQPISPPDQNPGS